MTTHDLGLSLIFSAGIVGYIALLVSFCVFIEIKTDSEFISRVLATVGILLPVLLFGVWLL